MNEKVFFVSESEYNNVMSKALSIVIICAVVSLAFFMKSSLIVYISAGVGLLLLALIYLRCKVVESKGGYLIINNLNHGNFDIIRPKSVNTIHSIGIRNCVIMKIKYSWDGKNKSVWTFVSRNKFPVTKAYLTKLGVRRIA